MLTLDQLASPKVASPRMNLLVRQVEVMLAGLARPLLQRVRETMIEDVADELMGSFKLAGGGAASSAHATNGVAQEARIASQVLKAAGPYAKMLLSSPFQARTKAVVSAVAIPKSRKPVSVKENARRKLQGKYLGGYVHASKERRKLATAIRDKKGLPAAIAFLAKTAKTRPSRSKKIAKKAAMNEAFGSIGSKVKASMAGKRQGKSRKA